MLGPYETSIEALLKKSFSTDTVSVIDKSGGCGQSFQVIVRSNVFTGLSKIKQHRMVQEVLKEEVRKWHAISLDTGPQES